MPDTGQPLFDGAPPASAPPTPSVGYLATNHLNLMYMLAAGLIMSPSGFGGKYYHDTLSAFPGWIPLFLTKVFKAAIAESVAEATHLKPSLVEVSLSHLQGPVHVLREGAIHPIEFPAHITGGEQALLVPSPLPTTLIKGIVFPSQSEVTACNAEVRDYHNVPWTEFPRRPVKTLFARATPHPWPPAGALPNRDTALHGPQAVGGSLAMLLQVAHRGDQGVNICRSAFGPRASEQHAPSQFLLSGAETWLRDGMAPVELEGVEHASAAGTAMFQQRLYWTIVDRVIAARDSSPPLPLEDVVLACLDAEAARAPSRLQLKVNTVRDALEDLTGLEGMGIAEMLRKFPTPFSRALTLLFVRPDCSQLLEFKQPMLTEGDWLAAALLCGACTGWQGLPLELRRIPDMAPAISHHMATLAHRGAQSDLAVGLPPARPRPLRELFMAEWTKQRQAAARQLAQQQGWDCLQTIVEFPDGHYKLQATSGKLRVAMQGEPAITYELAQEAFLQHFSHDRINDKTEAAARKSLPKTEVDGE